MSLLDEEEVFQKTDNNIRDWKNKLRFRYIVHPHSITIRNVMGWTPPATREIYAHSVLQDLFLNHIDKESKWVELEQILNHFDINDFLSHADSRPKNMVCYF
jgi:hypothetical protein